MSQKILIIGDDPTTIKILQSRFAHEGDGLESLIAVDESEGLNKMEEGFPDLVLLDVVLRRGGSGLAILEKIKKNPRINQIPVLVISAIGKEEFIKKALELGAVDYLVKGDVSMKEVMEKVRGVLKK